MRWYRVFTWSCFFGLLFLANISHAAWWTKVLELGEDAAKVASKASSVAGRSALQALKSRPAGLSAAHALEIVGGEVRAVDIGEREIVIASMAAGATLTLTPEGAELLKQAGFVVSEADVGPLQDLVRDAIKSSGKPASVVRNNGSVGRLIVRATPAGDTLLMEKYPGVFLDAGENSREVGWALEQLFRNDKIRVVSLMDPSDADELTRLDHVIGEYHIPAGSSTPNETIQLIRSQREKTVFVIGHVEGDKFVVRDAAGQVKSVIPFSDLEKAAEKADTSLFLLGCSAASRATTSAFIDPVNALHVADGLKDALSRTTIGDALSALSTAGDLVVSPQLVDPVRVMLVAEQRALAVDKRMMGAYRVLRLRTIGPERAEELAYRIVPYIPLWVQIQYLLGMFVLLFWGRGIVREWRGSRVPAPAFNRQPIACTLVKGLRAFGFLALMPFAVALNFMLIVGAWVVGTIPLAMHLGWPILIPTYFGWKWARTHAEDADGRSWMVRYLGIPLFVAIVGYLVALLIDPIEYFRHVEYADWLTRILYSVVTGTIALLTSVLMFRLLMRKKIKWSPSDIPGLVIAGTLLLIELIASRVVRKWESADG